MNLPQINERDEMLKEASLDFALEHDKIRKEEKIGYDDIFNTLSLIIINQDKEEDERETVSNYHKKMEEALKKIEKTYTLTYGETINILVSEMKIYSRSLVIAQRKS